jgi:hypothetical protein
LKHKAAKGELRQGLPVGLDYDGDDRVVLSGDEAVRAAIGCVFTRFAELGSARQVLTTLREDGILLPRRRGGHPRITWAPATYPAVRSREIRLSTPAASPVRAGLPVRGQPRAPGPRPMRWRPMTIGSGPEEGSRCTTSLTS